MLPAAPTPHRILSPGEPDVSLVGRSRELGRLRDALEQRGLVERCLLVTGEPGIGKSALLAAFRGLGQGSGASFLSVSGVEAEQHVPFAGLHQLLSPLASHLGTLPAVQRTAAETAIGLTAGDHPEVLLVGLAALGLVQQSASEQDVVIVVDDLAWIDRPSQVVLAFLVRRLTDQRVLLVAAARSGYDGALIDLGGVVELGPLSDADSERLLLRAHSHLDAATRSHVLSRARGNPLVLVELSKTLPRTFRVPSAGSTPALPLSRRLVRAFGGRLPGLPQATRDAVLVTATHPGADVALVLAAASRLHGAPVTVADLEPAVAAGLLDLARTTPEFRHPLVAAAAVSEETASRRLAAHAALGDVLAPGTPARAWHRASATLAPDDEIADELEALAPLVSARGALASAVQFLERSAQLTGDPRRRGHRYLDAAVHSLGTGDAVSSDDLLSRAAELPLDRRDQLSLEWGREVLNEGEPVGAGRVRRLCQLAAEAAALRDQHLALDLLLAAARCCWWSDFGADSRRAVLDQAQALLDHRDDPRHLAALAVAGTVGPGLSAEAGLSRLDPAEVHDAQTSGVRGFVAHVLADSPRALMHLDRAEGELRRRGAVDPLVRVLLTQVPDRLATGEWSRADAALQEARRLVDEEAHPVWELAVAVYRAHSAALRGHLSEALALADQSELAASRHQITILLSGSRLARGCAWAGVGRFSEAYAELRGLLVDGQPGPHARQLCPALMFLAEAAAHVDQRADAVAVVESWARRADAAPAPNLAVHLRYARAVLADDAAAEGLYQGALHQDLHAWPFVQAMLRAAYGAWLRRQRRIVESRRHTRAALLAFDAIGARGWAARARSELAAAGERHETEGDPLNVVLSPQQLEIARLAARGLSNRQIGEQLFLSPRTIGSHLYRIFPKLGVTSRVQLARRLGPDTAQTAPPAECTSR